MRTRIVGGEKHVDTWYSWRMSCGPPQKTDTQTWARKIPSIPVTAAVKAWSCPNRRYTSPLLPMPLLVLLLLRNVLLSRVTTSFPGFVAPWAWNEDERYLGSRTPKGAPWCFASLFLHLKERRVVVKWCCLLFLLNRIENVVIRRYCKAWMIA